MRKFFNFAAEHILPAAASTGIGAAIGTGLVECLSNFHLGEIGGITAGVISSGVYSSDLSMPKRAYAVVAGSLIAGFTAAAVRAVTGNPIASNAAGALTAHITTKTGLWLLGTNKERRALANV
jgi:hypothetical protein